MSGSNERHELQMFPLSTVLFPDEHLELVSFEARYRQMIRECLDAGSGFGVALISRGSEVGGGDERVHTGTLARIEQSVVLPDGQIRLRVVGCQRLVIDEWLDDDPYPRAIVTYKQDETTVNCDALLAQAVGDVRRARALYGELSELMPQEDHEESDVDISRASFRLCAALPMGALDRQHLLEIDAIADRLQALVLQAGELVEMCLQLLSRS